jgi:polar amino acid transport system substrate-binding protein
MKKYFQTALLVLTCIIVLALSGCGDKSPQNTIQSSDDVYGRVIGVLSGTPSARLADEIGVARGFNETGELINSLKAAVIDCALMENTVAAELISETPGVKLLGEPMLEYDLRFAVAKENAELLDAVNSALASLAENGTLDGLRGKYFAGKPYAYIPPSGVAPHPGCLTLAISSDDRPYSYINNFGTFSGLNIDTARAVCDILGVELQISVFETGELITAVWSGKADLALGWLPGDAGDMVNLSETYANLSHVIIVRK